MPCREQLVQLNEHHASLDAEGIALVGVGTGATWQAAALRAETLAFPLLCDPERATYRRLELANRAGLRLARPSSVRRYVASFARNLCGGPKQGRVTGDPSQLPGTAILDAGGAIAWLHRGQGLGDYPPLDETLRRARDVAGA